MPKTPNISLRLLKMIKRFPELYNSEHDLANDKAHSMVVWDTISYELDAPVSILKKKWQRLRSSHRKRCRSLKTAKSAATLPRDDVFNLMYSMLDVHGAGGDSLGIEDDSSGCSGPTLSIISEEGRSTRSSSASTIVAELAAARPINLGASPRKKSPDVEKATTRTASNRVLRSQKRGTRSEGPAPEATKKSHRPFSTPENGAISATGSANREKSFFQLTSRNNEPIRAFFESMALTVAKFPQHLQAATKTKICNVVFEAELELSPPMIR